VKLLFENWRQYLKEERITIDMSPEQNQALKGLYLKIRELIEHLAEWIEKNNLDPTTRKITRALRRGYTPPAGFAKLGRGTPTKIHFDTSKYKLALGDLLPDEFHVRFAWGSTGEEDASIHPDGWITLNTRNALDLPKMKQKIHHELQHILDPGAAGHDSSTQGVVKYLVDEGEVRAHAKEAAYKYFKNFPDEEVDFEEIKNWGGSWANYYKFSTSAADMIQKHGLDPSYEQKMKKAGDDFINYTNYFLSLYRSNY